MDNKEWGLISLGTISLSFIAYYCFQYSTKRNYFQKKKAEFQKIYSQCKIQIKNNTILPSNNNEKLVCFQNIKPTYNPSTFKMYQRERSLLLKKQTSSYRLNQNQMGGDFSFSYKDVKIRCDLNDFHVSSKLFQQQKKDIQIFKGLNNLKPIVCQVITTLKPTIAVSIFGKLYYDSNRLEYAIQPMFLTDVGQFRGLICDFYNNKMGQKFKIVIGLLVGGLILSFFTLYKPIKTLLRKIKDKKKEMKGGLNQIDFFKSKDHIIVKGSSLLNCENCKAKNVEIVYECGHLSLCIDCHEFNNSKQCPLCKRASAKFLKVYMS